MNKLSPMMEQYRSVKEQHPDKVLLFQVGDFYELFFEDARIAAAELDIALTSRDGGSTDPIPLAGVPIHAAGNYLNRLLSKGYRVVICDQVEDAAQAKGLVKREVTRILTPGTVTDPELLDESRNNFLAVLIEEENGNYYGLAYADVSTGEFFATECRDNRSWEVISDQLQRINPSELLCSSDELVRQCNILTKGNRKILIDRVELLPGKEEAEKRVKGQWRKKELLDMDIHNYPLATIALGSILLYLQQLHQLPQAGDPFYGLKLVFVNRYMVIDNITSRNLELTQNLRSEGKEGSLLELLDRCSTGMGRRLIRRWVEQPLNIKEEIESRLDAVEELIAATFTRRDLRKTMQKIFDLERFCSRLSYQRINARDLAALKQSLQNLDSVKSLIKKLNTKLIVNLNNSIPSLDTLVNLIEGAIVDEPPLSIKEGGLFKEGYCTELDELKELARESKQLLLEFENRERMRTGIKTLRVGYNRNFGYYIEVTKTNQDLVPPDYQRKQTLVNAERFTTEELYDLEEKITGARERSAQLEYNLFEALRDQVSAQSQNLLEAAHNLACLDCLQSLAEVAERNHYCRPLFSTNNRISIKQARHPVVEQLSSEIFVPNDINMDNINYILLITGPNMAGKSTYIRSAALISIMAQMGSFIPADEAKLPVLDRVFARVGASDDLSRGHSTFMVEMQETATILKEATAASLVILDEIGRGTSTYDGMSIARSVLEYISNKIGSKTLFSTHYHELTKMEGEVGGVKNYTMAVREKGKEVIFLRQVIPGKSDRSYGINVARLAGLPLEVLIRAEKILNELELEAAERGEQQLTMLPMFMEARCDHRQQVEMLEDIKNLDLNRISPLEAMKTLFEIQNNITRLEESCPDEE